jgi:membrane-bound lytic murein transglycosylase
MTNFHSKVQKTAENHRKPHVFRRKSTETAPLFVQNKPKVKSPQIDLNAFITNTYAQMDNWLNAKNKPNQTQFKPNAENQRKPLQNKDIQP